MKLAGRLVTLFLTEDGERLVHQIVGLHVSPFSAEVHEPDDLGIWIRNPRETNLNVFLLRWEFILGIEVPVDAGKVVGLKG
jgi:hypothetical protein